MPFVDERNASCAENIVSSTLPNQGDRYCSADNIKDTHILNLAINALPIGVTSLTRNKKPTKKSQQQECRTRRPALPDIN